MKTFEELIEERRKRRVKMIGVIRKMLSERSAFVIRQSKIPISDSGDYRFRSHVECEKHR